jgi:hypothetical protein
MNTTKHISLLSLALLALLAAPTSRAGNFSAPVQVTNPDTSPVPVRVLANTVRKPVQTALFITAANHWPTFQVPNDKRLVIEQLTSFRVADQRPRTSMVTLNTSAGGVSTWHYLGYAATADGFYWSFDKVVKFYADPGTTVVVNAEVFDDNPVTVTFVGYLEDPN